MVTGILEAAGGPAPGMLRPLQGTVTLRSAQQGSLTLVVGPDGTFSVQVPAGAYAVTGRSPAFESGETDCLAPGVVTLGAGATQWVVVPCQESAPVTVVAGATRRVAIACQER
jgi:hypothetical protein